jgi:multisubunit Na+/H+ antiporter MnhC subunit
MRNLQPHQIAQLPNFVIGAILLILGFIAFNEVHLILGIVLCCTAIYIMFYHVIQEYKKTIKIVVTHAILGAAILLFVFGLGFLDTYVPQIITVNDITPQNIMLGWMRPGGLAVGAALVIIWYTKKQEI